MQMSDLPGKGPFLSQSGCKLDKSRGLRDSGPMIRSFLFFSLFVLSACAPVDPEGDAGQGPKSSKYSDFQRLAWEAENGDGRKWSQILYQTIDREGEELIYGAEDIGQFCPRYSSLNRDEKIQFWASLFVAIAKFESNFQPSARTEERGKIDASTGTALFSEGLLMLSYQDVRANPVCRFNPVLDRALPINDLRRSILSPENNLHCGVHVMMRQLKRYDRIAIGQGAYWAVLKVGSRFQRIPTIQSMTRQSRGCL